MQGGARGGEARLELDQMPRKALHSKACGERSEDFRAAKQNENLALFQAVSRETASFFLCMVQEPTAVSRSFRSGSVRTSGRRSRATASISLMRFS